MHHFRLAALSTFHDCLSKSQPRLYSCQSSRSSVHFNWHMATLASVKHNIWYNCWNHVVSYTLSHMRNNYHVVYSLWMHHRTYIGWKMIGVDHETLTSVNQQDCFNISTLPTLPSPPPLSNSVGELTLSFIHRSWSALSSFIITLEAHPQKAKSVWHRTRFIKKVKNREGGFLSFLWSFLNKVNKTWV